MNAKWKPSWELIVLLGTVFLICGNWVVNNAQYHVNLAVSAITYSFIALVIIVPLILVGFVCYTAWIKISLQRATLRKAHTEASISTIVADPGAQVYIRDEGNDARWINTALEPRAVFGSAAPAITEDDYEKWAFFQQVKVLANQKGQQLAAAASSMIEAESNSDTIPDKVDLEALIRQEEPRISSLILGVGADNEVIRVDAKQLFHILVGGITRWGKSIFLQMFLYQLLMIKNVQVFLGDIEESTFEDFGLPYAKTPAEVRELLDSIVTECKRRKKAFKHNLGTYRSLEQYNIANPNDQMPYIFIILDEINALIDKSSPEYDEGIVSAMNMLGKRVAKYGVYLVVCGQDLKASVMPSGLKDQFNSRLQFKASDQYQARNLISDSEAHKITNRGRAFMHINDIGRTIQIQVPYIEETTIQALRRTDDMVVDGQVLDILESDPDLPTHGELRAIEMYVEGASLREITLFLYEKHGDFYNKKLTDLLQKHHIPLRGEK